MFIIMKLVVLYSFAAFLACNTLTPDGDGRPGDPAQATTCPPCPITPRCEHPVISNPDTCPCEHCPNCTFKGCVRFGWTGAYWQPDPCTVCSCFNDQERCTRIQCSKPECYGFPLVTRPRKCCPECDYGIAADECGPIPNRNQSLYVALGDERSCQEDVVLHGCDKDLLLKDGKIFKCFPKERLRSHTFERNCPIRKVVYKDVRECTIREAKPYEIPQDDIFGFDYDECAFYIDP